MRFNVNKVKICCFLSSCNSDGIWFLIGYFCCCSKCKIRIRTLESTVHWFWINQLPVFVFNSSHPSCIPSNQKACFNNSSHPPPACHRSYPEELFHFLTIWMTSSCSMMCVSPTRWGSNLVLVPWNTTVTKWSHERKIQRFKMQRANPTLLARGAANLPRPGRT